MCLIMTAITAVIFTAIHFILSRNGNESKSVFTSALMFWGATLMWSVDGIACVLEGEPFFDISMLDTILGVIIIATGLLIFALLNANDRLKAKRAK